MSRGGRADRAFSWPVRVYYEDTDAAGIVYYASYLRFMERARSEWLRALGIDQSRLRAGQRLQLVVAALTVRFLTPARLDDRLEVGVRVAQARRARLVLEQPLHRADGALVCRAEVTVACIDSERLRPRALPAALLTEIVA